MRPTRNDALAAQVDGLRAIALRLLDGLEGGHTNALYGPCRDLLSSVAEHDIREAVVRSSVEKAPTPTRSTK